MLMGYLTDLGYIVHREAQPGMWEMLYEDHDIHVISRIQKITFWTITSLGLVWPYYLGMASNIYLSIEVFRLIFTLKNFVHFFATISYPFSIMC